MKANDTAEQFMVKAQQIEENLVAMSQDDEEIVLDIDDEQNEGGSNERGSSIKDELNIWQRKQQDKYMY